MAEEAVQDVSPIESEVTQEVAVEPTTETTPSEVEQTADEEVTEEATETSEEATETESDPVTEETELAPKSQNRFQRLANENRDLKEKIKTMEELQVPTEQDYLDDGQDPVTAKLNAMDARLAQKDAVDSVIHLNQSIDNDLSRAFNEFPQLNPDSKNFNERLAKSIMDQYDRDSGAQYDGESGIMISTTQLPYTYIKDKMDLIGIASSQAKVEAQKNVESMVGHADISASTASTITPENETIDQMRDRLAGVKF